MSTIALSACPDLARPWTNFLINESGTSSLPFLSAEGKQSTPRSNVNIIGDSLDNDCGMDSCKLLLDYLHYSADGMYDLHSWSSKSGYLWGMTKIGGRGCRLLRRYAWSMAIPIIINLIFSAIVFFSDMKSGKSNKYESPFLLSFCYPQWRTLKILIGFFKHQDTEELANKLDENDKEVSFIEPFCESGLQVSGFTIFQWFSVSYRKFMKLGILKDIE